FFISIFLTLPNNKYDLNINEGEKAFLILSRKDSYGILISDNQNNCIIEGNIKTSEIFNNQIRNFINNKNLYNITHSNVDFKPSKKINMTNIFTLDDLIIKKMEDYILISYKTIDFCLYEKNTNFENCNYIYLNSYDSNLDFSFKDKTTSIFFNKNITLDEKTLKEIYSKWIDIYKIKQDMYTFVLFSGYNNTIININKEVKNEN
ncbi:MAG: hypothetical protein ACK5HL_03175, partial [Bacilli bacterium]